MARRSSHNRSAAEATRPDLDVVIAADMTVTGDLGYRIAQETRYFAAQGQRVGLLQAAAPGPDARIAAEVQTLARRGLAEIVSPMAERTVASLIVHAPSTLPNLASRLAGLSARDITFVCHEAADFRRPPLPPALRRAAEQAVFAPVRRSLRTLAPRGFTLARKDWAPFVGILPTEADRRDPTRAGIGWVVTPSTHSAPEPSAETDIVTIDLTRHGAPSLDRIMSLDALIFMPKEPVGAIVDTLIQAVLSAGRPVVLPEGLRPHVGAGPVYTIPELALDAARAAILERETQMARSRPRPALRAVEEAADVPVPDAHRRPVMMLASNGVGIGHVSRLLAIARRLEPDQPVLFVSQAQAIDAIERCGYLAEYLPSATYIGGDFEVWDAWFRHDLEKLIDAYDPCAVVYDGNNPSPGLVEAVASRRDCRLAWVRRGLWGTSKTRFMANARWCDLVLEPGELEGQPDTGATAPRRNEAIMVPPVTLLDEGELLSRQEAARALDLDPAKPAVLIQLGAGYNRDIVSTIDRIVTTLQSVKDLQICVAEWVNGAQSLACWPDVRIIRGFPLSQYFAAFDFTIAASGYNTFHELVRFGLPAIFVPNRHPSMDDQAGRAEFAQDHQAAFVLDEDDLDDLPEIVQIMLDARGRGFLRQSAQKLVRENGAVSAARALHALTGDRA